METLFKLLRIALNITGLDTLSESVTIWHTIRRIFFYISGLIIIFCFSYSVSFNPDIILSDKIFLLIADIDFISIMVQSLLFWHYKEKILTIMKEVTKMHEPRDEIWLANDAEPVFEECFKTSYKICK